MPLHPPFDVVIDKCEGLVDLALSKEAEETADKILVVVLAQHHFLPV
jgi:hypothetical protein